MTLKPGEKAIPAGPAGAMSLLLVCCVYLSCLGWILSAVHELNVTGYSLALLADSGRALWFKRRPGSGAVSGVAPVAGRVGVRVAGTPLAG